MFLLRQILLLLLSISPVYSIRSSPAEQNFEFLEAPDFQNGPECPILSEKNNLLCNPQAVHISMTLDPHYLRGTIAAVHSILKHTSCPQNIFFHFVVASGSDKMDHPGMIISSVFASLSFKMYSFDESRVKTLISPSIRQALENPLNYARIYLSEILETCVTRTVYLDSDVILVEDIQNLWRMSLSGKTIGAPEYCQVDLTKYFTNKFWLDFGFPTGGGGGGGGRRACYFNTGVMVMDLERWREMEYTIEMEKWMKVQKEERIYELGSLPPFLLVFGGGIEAVDHRWNQHGLGGDNVVSSCRKLHPGRVGLIHWSGKGKPWVRLDEGKPCPIDYLWQPYDLFRKSEFNSRTSVVM